MTEPVAYINVQERKLEWATPIKWETPTVVKMDKVPLYTAPPTQPETEPVAWLNKTKHGTWSADALKCEGDEPSEPLYTTPPQREWQGLTDEEIVKVFDYIDFKNGWLMHFYRAIEAKLKEKNG